MLLTLANTEDEQAESEEQELYKSPIEKIYGELQTQIVQEDEKLVMKAIREVGVNVDKDELIKALQYDRNQYTKGYEDGKNDVLDKIRAEIQAIIGEHNLDDYDFCSGLIVARKIIDKYKVESEKP